MQMLSELTNEFVDTRLLVGSFVRFRREDENLLPSVSTTIFVPTIAFCTAPFHRNICRLKV